VLAPELDLASVHHVLPADLVNPMNYVFSSDWPILKMTDAAMNIDVFDRLPHVIMDVPAVVQSFVKMVQV
jgi:hypothetical protein